MSRLRVIRRFSCVNYDNNTYIELYSLRYVPENVLEHQYALFEVNKFVINNITTFEN